MQECWQVISQRVDANRWLPRKGSDEYAKDQEMYPELEYYSNQPHECRITVLRNLKANLCGSKRDCKPVQLSSRKLSHVTTALLPDNEQLLRGLQRQSAFGAS
jgi:hypothetical protein